MEHFLERLAKALLREHGGELERIAVVLPGRRAGIHLQKYLAANAGSALWSPELFDPSSFMARIAGMRQGSTQELLFMLYEAHRLAEGQQAEPLSQVLQWAPVTLGDMGQVDAHLLDLDRFYRDLRSYEEIEAWSLRSSVALSAAQQRAVHQWDRTRRLHLQLNALFEERGIGHAGLVSRNAASTVIDPAWRAPWDMVWFAGLNALEPAALVVVERLVERGLGKLAWDADRYYLEDKDHEAGRFIRRAIGTLSEGVLPIPHSIVHSKRTIESVEVPNKIAQVQFAADQLRALSPEERAGTAVVLAEEDLLLPLLGALPADLGPMNVTMGVALSSLPVHGLVEAFLELHANANAQGPLRADLERVLLHPMMHCTASAIELLASWRGTGMGRVPWAMASGALSQRPEDEPTIVAAFTPAHDTASVHARIRHLISIASDRCGDDPLAREQLFQLTQVEFALENALVRLGTDAADLRSYRIIRERALREVKLPLFGEPLAGLQIVGLLETRAIDHQRVIILGATEEGLTSRVQQSWIPFDIRRHHKLPLREDTEAIASYHMHRLLHGSNSLCLVHHKGDDGTGEPSRLLAQWKHELVPRSDTRMAQRSVQVALAQKQFPSISVQKSPLILDRIATMAAKGFSPSALGTWLRCPLDFYFTYLLDIRAQRGEDATLGSDILGNAVHALLEEAFQPFLARKIDPVELRKATALVPEKLRMHLGKEIRDEILGTGHFLLSMEMAAHGVRTYLEREADRCTTEDTVLRSVEADLSAVLPSGDLVRGRCDRMEERNGLLHILDLKTGNVKQEDIELKGLERDQLRPTHRYALQLLAYACMAFAQDPVLERLRAGIIPLSKPSVSDGIWLKLEGSDVITRDQLQGITHLLTDIIVDVKNPSLPFKHDTTSERCASCVG